MIIDTTQTKIERAISKSRFQEQLRLTANDPNLVINTRYWVTKKEVESLPKFKVCDFTVDEKKWVRAFNAQWAQNMKDTLGYDPNEF